MPSHRLELDNSRSIAFQRRKVITKGFFALHFNSHLRLGTLESEWHKRAAFLINSGGICSSDRLVLQHAHMFDLTTLKVKGGAVTEVLRLVFLRE